MSQITQGKITHRARVNGEPFADFRRALWSLRLQTTLHWPIVPFNYARCESEIARLMSYMQAQSQKMRAFERLALLSSLDDNLALGLLLI